MACTPSGSLMAVGGTTADGNAALHFIDAAGGSLPWCSGDHCCFMLTCELAHGMSGMRACSLCQALHRCVQHLWKVQVMAGMRLCMAT